METIQSPKDTKAKKTHICNFCNQKIDIGEVYEKSVHVYDGSVYDWKSHKDCSFLANELDMYEHADEGVTMDIFHEFVHNWYDDYLISKIPDSAFTELKEIVGQIRHVSFRYKLSFVIGKIKSKKLNA